MTLTIDLPDEEQAILSAEARAHGLSAEQYAQQLIKQALTGGEVRKPLSARIREIWAGMPEDVRAKLPDDGASQHDHYIYGLPKREQ